MTTAKNVTRKQAERVLAAVEKKYAAYLTTWQVINGKIDFDAPEVPVPDSERPYLVEGYKYDKFSQGCWAIVWESSSPDGWAIDFYEDIPGTFCEAIYSYTLGIYPEWS